MAMDHANSVPLQRHYLGREIDKDLFSILRGIKPQHALVKQSCSVGHSISKRRPVDLTAEQSASISNHPLIRRLTRELRRLRKGSRDYTDVIQLRRKEKQRLRRDLKQQIRHQWTADQAVEDIERQIQGLGFANPTLAVPGQPQRPAQKRLMEVLRTPAATDIQGQYRRRDKAIDLIAAYCTVEEGCTVPQGLTALAGSSRTPHRLHASTSNQVEAAMLSVLVQNKEQRPRRCFLCVGKARSFSPDDPHMDQLLREFYTSGDLTKHVRRKHLKKLKNHDSSYCQVCKIELKDKAHLQNHALGIHGTVT